MGLITMNIFDSLQVYAEKWQVTNRRAFNAEEKAAISKAEVVPSTYGNSVCFTMVAGGKTYIPLSENSSKGVGELIDLSSAELLTLSKRGERDILRVEA